MTWTSAHFISWDNFTSSTEKYKKWICDRQGLVGCWDGLTGEISPLALIDRVSECKRLFTTVSSEVAHHSPTKSPMILAFVLLRMWTTSEDGGSMRAGGSTPPLD